MAEFPAINTSPLIFLSKGKLLHLLQIISPQIIVPEAVALEIQAYGKEDLTAKNLASTEWLIIQKNTTNSYSNPKLGFGCGRIASANLGIYQS